MDKYPSGFVMDFYEEISNEKIDADVREEVILGRDAERLAMNLKCIMIEQGVSKSQNYYKLNLSIISQCSRNRNRFSSILVDTHYGIFCSGTYYLI